MATIEIPLYRQTLDFTCGAACILMTLSHFDPDFRTDPNTEIDIWREGTSVLALGMGRYGLSFPFLKRGFRVEITTNSEGIDFFDRIKARLNERQVEIFKQLYEERKARVSEMGLSEKLDSGLTMSRLGSVVEAGGVPIILTDAKELGDVEAPHWVVFTGTENGGFRINNPLDTEAGRSFGAPDFDRILGFKGEKTVVSVYRGGVD